MMTPEADCITQLISCKMTTNNIKLALYLQANCNMSIFLYAFVTLVYICYFLSNQVNKKHHRIL